MIINNKYQIDLLRKRRELSNSKVLTFSKIKKIKKLGTLYALLIISLGISICGWTSYQTFRRIKYKEKLAIEAIEYQLLITKYNSILKNLRSIYKVNNQIAQGIVGTKSGSALLLELRDKLPKTIQLITIKSKGKNLTLQGRADQPYALSSINSLELQLSDSFLIKGKSVFLTKAWESMNNEKSHLNFTINSKFSIPSSKELLANYERLGSFGLYKRVSLLKKEGLIK